MDEWVESHSRFEKRKQFSTIAGMSQCVIMASMSMHVWYCKYTLYSSVTDHQGPALSNVL